LYLSLKYGVVSLTQHDLMPNVKTKRRGLEIDQDFEMGAAPSLPGRALVAPPFATGMAVEKSTSELGLRQRQIEAAFWQFCSGTKPQEAPLLDLMKDKELLSTAVEAVSSTIINAQPTSYPRWAEDDDLKLKGSSETGSLLLKHQLEEKIQKHAMFFAFLHGSGLWPAIDDDYRVAIFAHAEKLHAASALR